jgi:hypothetical protein
MQLQLLSISQYVELPPCLAHSSSHSPRPHLAVAAAGDPESFSRVDLSLPDSELRRRFPRFPVGGPLPASQLGSRYPYLVCVIGWRQSSLALCCGLLPMPAVALPRASARRWLAAPGSWTDVRRCGS